MNLLREFPVSGITRLACRIRVIKKVEQVIYAHLCHRGMSEWSVLAFQWKVLAPTLTTASADNTVQHTIGQKR
jgi:hypothetical protein